MSEKFAKFPIGPRSSRREIADYINHAFEASDIVGICEAISAATHLHNISDIAKKSGIERPSVYRAFSGSKTFPNFNTVLHVLNAMGFQKSGCAGANTQSERVCRVVPSCRNLTSDLETKIRTWSCTMSALCWILLQKSKIEQPKKSRES
jgi:probable addiction module antidote protein